MNKKNVILIVVVIVLVGAAGWILYAGIFRKTAGVLGSDSPNIDLTQKNIVNLLPYGTKLNFDPVENRTNIDPPFKYIQVNPSTDVGVPEKDLIRNSASNTTRVPLAPDADRILLQGQ